MDGKEGKRMNKKKTGRAGPFACGGTGPGRLPRKPVSEDIRRSRTVRPENRCMEESFPGKTGHGGPLDGVQFTGWGVPVLFP